MSGWSASGFSGKASTSPRRTCYCAASSTSPDTIPYGRFCWNQECQYCRISYAIPGVRTPGRVLSCKVIVHEGMEITDLSPELAWNLKKVLNGDKG
jgi:hypothetical protein